MHPVLLIIKMMFIKRTQRTVHPRIVIVRYSDDEHQLAVASIV